MRQINRASLPLALTVLDMANILVVEDDEPTGRLVSRILQRAGHAVDLATDGRAALDLLAASTFDLIVTDIFMPVADGMELVLSLTRQPDRPRIIAMSGGSLPARSWSPLGAAKAFGADAVLNKPFLDTELLAAVNDQIGAAAAAQPQPSPVAP